jgi:excisionase family DNA binding protein
MGEAPDQTAKGPASEVCTARIVCSAIQKEVSELLKIQESTVYKMIREGRTPVFMIGAEWRFLKDQILHCTLSL